MDQEMEQILESIEIDEKEIMLFDLRQRILNATVGEVGNILDDLKLREKAHVLGHNLFNDQPFYFLFEAYAHSILPNHQMEAIDRANRSASFFHMRNLQWN